MKIDVTITGISPLIMNKFSDDAAIAATAGTRTSAVGKQKPPLEDARERLYTSDTDGSVIVPGPNLLRCFIEGGSFFKNGKSKITTVSKSLVPAAVAIDEVELPITSEGGWSVDTRAVRIPATGGRILRHRPIFHDWQLSASMTLDETVISPELLRDIIDAAGTKCGLGDFRPSTKGPFGRFKVAHWTETAEESRAA